MVNAVIKTLVRTLVWFLNTIDLILGKVGIRLYSVTLERILSGLPSEQLKEAAKPEVVRPLAAFARGLERDRRLNLVDRYVQVSALRRQLEMRVGISNTMKEHPDIAGIPIRRPMFIIGFPRTGTTLLYNLLAADPEMRAPYFFEIVTPFPPGLPENWRESDRFKKCEDVLDVRRMTGNADFDRAHLMRADHPEECLFILFRNFLMYHPMIRIETCTELANWFYELNKDEFTEIYKYYKTQLQMIGYKEMRKKRYILKAHIHMMALDALLEVFPDACLIFTYRKLTDMIGSFCSMVFKGTESWGPADVQYGQRALKLLSTMANRAINVMKKYDNVPEHENPFFNVEYSELVAKPKETVRAIYDHYNLHLTQEAENAMQNYLGQNRQHKHGSHKYSIEEFGISRDDVKTQFAPYLDYLKDKSDNLL